MRVRKATPWWLVDFSRATREVVAVVASADRRHWFWPPLPQEGVTATVDARPAVARPPAPLNLVAFILDLFVLFSFFLFLVFFFFMPLLQFLVYTVTLRPRALGRRHHGQLPCGHGLPLLLSGPAPLPARAQHCSIIDDVLARCTAECRVGWRSGSCIGVVRSAAAHHPKITPHALFLGTVPTGRCRRACRRRGRGCRSSW